MDHKKQRTKHNLSCALLTCAEGLLDAGLETIIIDTLNKLSKSDHCHNDNNVNDKKIYHDINNVSSLSISNICGMIILSQSSIIIQCLIDLLDRYHVIINHNTIINNKLNKNDNNIHINDFNIGDVDNDEVNDVYMNHTYEMFEDDDKKTNFNMSKINYGKYGRMLVSDQG